MLSLLTRVRKSKWTWNRNTYKHHVSFPDSEDYSKTAAPK